MNNYPDEWNIKTLDEVCSRIWIGLVTTMTKFYVKKGIKLIRNSDITKNGIDINNLIQLDPAFSNKHNKYLVKTNDVVTIHTGDVGTSCVISKELSPAQGFATINSRLNRQLVLPEFYSTYLNSDFFKNQVQKVITGDGRSNLNLKDFIKLMIVFPPLPEQKKITEILSGVDKTLKLIDLKINKLSQKRKSISQRIFLNNENSFCEFKELGELADFYSGRAFKSSELSDDGIKITRISNLHKPKFPYWRFKGEYSHKIIAKNGDILFSWAGVASSINIHRYKGEETLLNQHIYNFKFHNELMKEWTFYYVRYFLPTLRTQIEGGAGQLHLTKRDVQGIKIPIHSTHFMENCILLLKNIDKTIFNYQMKRSKISLLKNGLSRDLLSGLKNLKI